MLRPQMNLTAAETSTGTAACRSQPRIRAVIADDEKLARATITMLLKSQNAIELVGSASTGPEAVTVVRRMEPDLLFLDVDMPGLSGFEVLERIPEDRRPAVIFTTADKAHAPKAFDVEALDYLLKPFTRARFQLALKRARARLRPELVRI